MFILFYMKNMRKIYYIISADFYLYFINITLKETLKNSWWRNEHTSNWLKILMECDKDVIYVYKLKIFSCSFFVVWIITKCFASKSVTVAHKSHFQENSVICICDKVQQYQIKTNKKSRLSLSLSPIWQCLDGFLFGN